MKRLVSVVLLSCVVGLVCAQEAQQITTFTSPDTRVQTLEVYSSQGCSSCPPAEQWTSLFLNYQGLWDKVVPMVFHVDYWDDLGWKDPFAQRAFSRRQRAYKREGLSKAVYTPGFMVNGREWRGWWQRKDIPANFDQAGVLSLELQPETLKATYSRFDKNQRLHVAILGFGLTTHVRRGENRNRRLEQDFVVLSFESFAPGEEHWESPWSMPEQQAERYAISAWVSESDSLLPLQATGGWLSTKPQELTQTSLRVAAPAYQF